MSDAVSPMSIFTLPESSPQDVQRQREEREAVRLRALQRYDVLDQPVEPQFDRLVHLAHGVFGTEEVRIVLLDRERQWLLAEVGSGVRELSRSESFCEKVVQSGRPLVIPDTRSDPQVASFHTVTSEPGVRFYAGVPLMTPDGEVLGTFCLLHPQPRTLSDTEQAGLAMFAELAMHELSNTLKLLDMKELVMRDALTALPNRAAFQQQVKAMLAAASASDRSGQPVREWTVAMLDIDRFKLINDTFGHFAGDDLLVEVATRLRALFPVVPDRPLRDRPVFVSRMGGDEFALLLRGDQAQALLLARQLEAVFERPFLVAGQEVFVHWSLGLSSTSSGEDTAQRLLTEADTAMYRAKRNGGGVGVYDASSDVIQSQMLEMVTSLHHALVSGDLRLYYQPFVRCSTRTVHVHEGLLRWETSQGLVSMARFIPVIEASGLMVPVGRWVLRSGLAALRSGAMDRLTVNVSPMEFIQPEFVSQVAAVLRESGVDPSRLILEITETAVIDSVRGVQVLHDLRALGVTLALDDFGSGYSSLSALANLPVHILKIDQEFVRFIGMPSSAGERAVEVIRAVVAMAGVFGLETVAEGVETLEQAVMLESLGCTYLQGYLFGRPEPRPLPDGTAFSWGQEG